MSLEKMALRSGYAIKPEIALAELATMPCEIITLDVDLGSMNGFDLSAQIRKIDLHRETPIIFLSGLMSTKDRIATLSGGPYDFIPKPYNLNELGVIALGAILRRGSRSTQAPLFHQSLKARAIELQELRSGHD